MINSTRGFTVIEVLIAVLLLGIITFIVLGSLTGYFDLSRKNTTQVNATSRGQAVMEEIRGQWLNQTAYDRACVNSSTDLSNVTVILQDEDAAGGAVGSSYSLTTAADCTNVATVAAVGASNPPAALRSVRVKTNVPQGTASPSELVLEISRP